MIEVIKKISLIKLIDGGAAILEAANRNHHNDIIGAPVISPLVKYILRVWVTSYLRLAKIKRADELNPWAIIIINAPYIPHVVLVSSPASIRPICPTDEYAINDFKSGCRKQINLVVQAPTNASLISIDDLSFTM